MTVYVTGALEAEAASYDGSGQGRDTNENLSCIHGASHNVHHVSCESAPSKA